MLTSTLLPLALAGAVSMASASPIQYAGRAPSVVDVDGLQREFKQSVERSVAQLSARSPEKDEDCTTHRSRKVKKALSKSAFTLPLKNPRDWEYLASVKVGTPQQNIDLMVDTGSADLLIPKLTDTCGEADGCFNSTRSRTFNKLKEETRVFTFGQGAVEGRIARDKVIVGFGRTFIQQELAIFDSSFLNGTFGVLGLAWPSISKLEGRTVFEGLIQNGYLPDNLFSLYHSRGGAAGSELTLGGVNPDRYTGEVTTLPVISQSHWTVPLTGAVLNGETVYSGFVATAIDSGTTSTIIPKAITDAYFSQVEGVVIDPTVVATTTVGGVEVVGQIYQYPCDAKLPTLGFTFAGSDRVFEMSQADAFIPQEGELCVASIVGADVVYMGQKAALLGVSFLKSWYSVFNFDDATVSLAQAKH